MHTQTVPLVTRNIAHSTRGRILSGRLSTLLRISYIRNSVRPTFHLLRIFHIRRLTPDGRGGRFNFPGQTCLDPLIVLTRRVFLSVYSCGVILKLPNISDRHFEIFCFRYLVSKSPNSPCNPPIIGFLSL